MKQFYETGILVFYKVKNSQLKILNCFGRFKIIISSKVVSILKKWDFYIKKDRRLLILKATNVYN